MAMEGDQVVQEIIPAEDDEVNISLTNHTEGRIVLGRVLILLPVLKLTKYNFKLK